MSMIASLSLQGMYDYRPDIFDNLVLPSPPLSAPDIGLLPDQLRAPWVIETAEFIDFLCFKSMSMSLAVPNADFFKAAVGVWSKAHIHEWQRLFDTYFYKYNPLWNKDFTLTENETGTQDNTNQETNGNIVAGNNTITGYTHGYSDGGNVDPDDNLAWTHADKTKGNNTLNSTGTRNSTSEGTSEKERTVTEKGNIGVTQVQQMIEAERKQALFSIEDFIADEFIKNFCLMVW